MVEPEAKMEEKKHRLQGAAFMGLIGGVSALYGFSRTLGNAKKSDSKLIEKGGRQTALLLDEGSTLALRALGWGTLYAVLGTSLFCYGVWKLSGAQNFEEFRQKMGNKLPKISTDEPPTTKTDFDDFTDLMKYLASSCRE